MSRTRSGGGGTVVREEAISKIAGGGPAIFNSFWAKSSAFPVRPWLSLEPNDAGVNPFRIRFA
jgi:hypothetical protein